MRTTTVPEPIVATLRSICRPLPEAHEEPAWVGTRWRIRQHTFAHVLAIEAGWPPAYAKAAAEVVAPDGPTTVLTFRSSSDEVLALRHAGPPFFLPGWWPDIVGLALGPDTDWTEVAELVTESYRLLAPVKLAALLEPLPPADLGPT